MYVNSMRLYIATQMEDTWKYCGLSNFYKLPVQWHDGTNSGKSRRFHFQAKVFFPILGEIGGNILGGAGGVFSFVYMCIGNLVLNFLPFSLAFGCGITFAKSNYRPIRLIV